MGWGRGQLPVRLGTPAATPFTPHSPAPLTISQYLSRANVVVEALHVYQVWMVMSG